MVNEAGPPMQNRILPGIGVLLLLGCLCTAAGDVLTLKDGTTVEGSIIKFGTEYRVRLADGSSRVVPESRVASWGRGGAAVPVGLAGIKSRADAVDAPVVAVTLWEKFIESNPGSPDLPAARAELERWKKLHDDDAERIAGKWVGGEERAKLLADVDRLCSEAREQLENQTIQAVEKYEKALKLYPNCFEANFALGWYYLRKGSVGTTGRGSPQDLDRAIASLQSAVRLRPDSASALSNLAIGYNFRGRFEDAVLTAFKAATLMDNKPIVENLIGTLVRAPDGMKQNNQKVRAIIPQAAVLAQKYNIPARGTGQFQYIMPERNVAVVNRPSGPRDGPAGIIGNGSGFLVSADGYFITNRHVVEEKNRLFRVRLDDRTEKLAELVAIDPTYDIALMKISHDKPLPYLKLAKSDLPRPGAPCMVLGYPIATRLDFKMQVTSGEISSVNPNDEYQVTLVANTTHGNSGGPIVDRDGNVIGILSAGTSAFNATYLRAISSGQIRQFLDRMKEKHSARVETVEPANAEFNGEKLAEEARKATLMVMIIRSDGKEE